MRRKMCGERFGQAQKASTVSEWKGIIVDDGE